jgi:hypothetical protein
MIQTKKNGRFMLILYNRFNVCQRPSIWQVAVLNA